MISRRISPLLAGSSFQSHVVDDEQLGLEVARQEAVFLGCSPFGTQVPHQIEDAAVLHAQAGAHRLHPEGQGKVTFPDAGRPDEEHVAGVPDPLTGCQMHDPGTRDAGIEAEVEVGKSAAIAEPGMPVADSPTKADAKQLREFCTQSTPEEITAEAGEPGLESFITRPRSL
jgi:hypothetical protein